MELELEEVVAELAPGLLRYARAKTGSVEMAEDVAQEALVALVSRWRRSGAPDSPAAFVFAIARRRAGRAVLKRSLLVPIDAFRDPPDRHPDPSEAAISKATLEEATRALARVEKRDREVVLLAAAGDLSMQDVASVLGISPAAAKMRLHRARKRLRSMMEVAYEAS